jgi:hypothetical protein
MIATMLAGGLGNQMFQYAAGRGLASRLGTGLLLDRSPFGRTSHFAVNRPYELDKLAISAISPGPAARARLLLARRPSAALRKLSGWTTMREEFPGFDPRFETMGDGSYLIGYWQSWRYFQNAAQTVYAELQPHAPLSSDSLRLQDSMRRCPSLSLHVRRGDYLTIPTVMNSLGEDYYGSALRFLQARLEGLRSFVFSDDLAWCRQAFEPFGLDLIFVDCNSGNDSWQDLFLMSACRHNIIANSSFSWWGAWLGDNGNKAADRQVIAPKQWFCGEHVSATDRFPPSWVVM